MKIAQLAPVNHHISTSARYGVSLNVAQICNGLTQNGHRITLFTAKDADVISCIDGRAIPTHSRQQGLSDTDALPYNHLNVSNCFAQAESFDLIHSHYDLISHYYTPLTKTPVIHTVHNPLPSSFLRIQEAIRKHHFISLSLAQRALYPQLNWIANIYHGIDTVTYPYQPNPQDYLLFLGRIVPDKGVHHAINAAKAAGLPLIIAGMSKPDDNYWHTMIEPQIDGIQIRYVGPADFARKVSLLQGAKALLFSSTGEETFGLTMIEAMSCGTPVIGFDSGAVGEVVQDKETGFVVKTEKQMTAAIKKIHTLSRGACRERAERFFSVQKMIQGYERVYNRLIK